MTTEKTIGKTQILLKNAARQNDSPTSADSSVASAARDFSSESEAKRKFSHFHKKLLSIEHWNASSGISSFELFGENGNAQPKKPTAGDFIKVSLPGSGKDDWVKIIEIYESPDEVILTVQPSHDPTDERNEQTTSHFFTSDSTNNFCLRRQASTISFHVIGLDEKINTEETSGVLETVRNYATANLGCLLGIQKTQWETFCKNFLEMRNEK